jgi:uncharacterized protein YndB with AHSA1/START domain
MPNAETKYGGIGSDAVRAKTGKDWDGWLKVLDKEKATKLSHKEIAQLLYDKYKVPPWWCQMVTVGYEQARGLRAVHQKVDGYSASVSKTMNAPLSALYDACADETKRVKWIGRKRYSVSKATANKSLRLGWGRDDAMRVDFNLYARGSGKSQIAIEHSKLADADEVAKMKTYWKGALDKLAKMIEV